MLRDEAPMRACSPAVSSASAFHRKVARSRSRAPRRCSPSVPASGGSHGMSVLVIGAPYPPSTAARSTAGRVPLDLLAALALVHRRHPRDRDGVPVGGQILR